MPPRKKRATRGTTKKRFIAKAAEDFAKNAKNAKNAKDAKDQGPRTKEGEATKEEKGNKGNHQEKIYRKGRGGFREEREGPKVK